MLISLNPEETKLAWTWDEADILGDLAFNCPNCGKQVHEEVYDLEEQHDNPLTCKNCGKKFVIKRTTVLKPFDEQ